MPALVWIGAGALVGAWLEPLVAADVPVWIAQLVALALGSALVVIGARTTARPRRWVGPAAGVVALLATLETRPPPELAFEADVEGVVVERLPNAVEVDATRVVASRDEDRGRSALVRRVRLPSSLGAAEHLGQRVAFHGRLVTPLEFRNASPHPSWARDTGLRRATNARDVTFTVERSWAGWLAQLREHVGERIRATTAPDVAGLVEALVLGRAHRLAEEDATSARAAGLTHVLAVSGMHVTLIVGLVVAGLRWSLVRIEPLSRRIDVRRIAWTIGALIAPPYAAFAGGSPSAWRAAWTATLVWALAAAGRRAEAFAATAFVAVAGFVVAPDTIRSPAFALSVVATAAVLKSSTSDASRDDSTSAIPPHAGLVEVVRTSIRASIATAPITLWCFASLPLVAVIANVVVTPLVAAVLLPLGTLHALVASVAPALAEVTRVPTELVSRAFLASAALFAEASPTTLVPPLDTAELFAVAALALALLRSQSWSTRLGWSALALVALAGGEARLRWAELPRDELRITFLDVGQGDGALVDLPDGSAMLVDTGGRGFGGGVDPGERAIVPFLRARRRTTLETVVVTHPHPDHYGGFAAVAASVPIGRVWDSGQARAEDAEGAWMRTLRGRVVREPEELCGRPEEHAGARVEVLSPCPHFDPGWDANDNSLVLRIRYGHRTFLLLGDAEAHTEGELVRRDLAGADVIKVGHHGSHTSSTDALVDASHAWLAVISAGRENRYGHPHEDVVARWARGAEHVARTDLDGSVTVRTDGDALSFSTWSGRTETRRAP